MHCFGESLRCFYIDNVCSCCSNVKHAFCIFSYIFIFLKMKLNLYNRNPTVGLALPFHIQCVKLRMLHQRIQSHIYFL